MPERTRGSGGAGRPRRSRSPAGGSPSSWCRPGTTGASRRTAGSRSSSSKAKNQLSTAQAAGQPPAVSFCPRRGAALFALRMGKALLAALLVAVPLAAGAQTRSPGGNVQNDGNDPLTPKAAIELQDYVQPVLNAELGSGANQVIVRGVLPHDALGWPQIMRASLPVVDTAYGPAGSTTGLGDLTVHDVPLIFFVKPELGVGPLLVAPTSTSRA